MTITVENETTESFDFSLEQVAETVITAALDYEGFPYEAEVSLTLVTEETIQELNREMRNIDRVTDVLSFPMIEYTKPAYFEELENSDDNFNPDTGEAMLGDIVICVKRMDEQAEEYGHSRLREFAFLTVHSMLHLMGYDHMTPAEEQEMCFRQEAILKKLQITRENG